MVKKRTSAGPLIVAIVMLLLPVLYVGSYLALVTPGGWAIHDPDGGIRYVPSNYRKWSAECASVFWPLEQIDRKWRPRSWVPINAGPADEWIREHPNDFPNKW